MVEAYGDVFYSFQADGIVGLAFPSMSLTQGYRNILMIMIMIILIIIAFK